MTEETTVKIERFSGKKKDWKLWSEVFKSRAESKGLLDVLLMKPEDLPDVKADLTKQEVSILSKKNVKAYMELIACISMKMAERRVAMNLVIASKSSKYPKGNCAQAWKNLERKYAPQTAAELSRLKKLYVNAKLRPGSDPDMFIDYLERLRMELSDMGDGINDKTFLIDLISKLNEDYENVVEKISDMIDSADENNELNVEIVRDRLRAKFERMTKDKPFFKKNKQKFNYSNEDSDDEDTDEALMTNGSFKGRCHKCGQYGHKGANCPSIKGIVCYKCKKPGHKAFQCKAKPNKTSDKGDVMLTCADGNDKILNLKGKRGTINENTFIADSGASTHMTMSENGLFDVENIKSKIGVGDDHKLLSTKVGKKKIIIHQNNGKNIEVILTNVKYVPELKYNLFSLTKALKSGWNIGNNDEIMYIKKDGINIMFDQVFETESGQITGVKTSVPSIPQGTMKKEKPIHAMILHGMLGHANEETCKKTANKFGIQIEGKFVECEDCMLAKAKQQNLKKKSDSISMKVGERIFLDITPFNYKSFGGSKNWLLIVDDYSDFCWSYFLKTKDELAEKVVNFIKDLMMRNKIKIECIRLDNAGENKSLNNLCLKEGLGIKFEWTAPGTPQQNGKVERKFATLFGYARAMLNEAEVPLGTRKGLWAEAASTATHIHNICIRKNTSQTPYELVFDEYPRIIKDLKRFGEVGIVTFRKGKIGKSKLENKGRHCIFVGYALEAPFKTYKMFDLRTRKIIISRNVKWINKMYGEWKGNKIKDSKIKFEEIEDEANENGSTDNENESNDDDKDTETDENEKAV